MTFFKGSRYERVGEVETTAPDGRVVRYKRVRLIPDPPAGRAHLVRDTDRLDRLAWEHYRDPERWWLICDASRVSWPPDLLAEPGAPIGIPDPEDAR